MKLYHLPALGTGPPQASSQFQFIQSLLDAHNSPAHQLCVSLTRCERHRERARDVVCRFIGFHNPGAVVNAEVRSDVCAPKDVTEWSPAHRLCASLLGDKFGIW